MQIILNITPDNELSISTNGNISQSQLTDVLCTAQLLSMQNVIKAATKANTLPHTITKLKEHMWDQYNQSASNVLDEFIPEFQRRDLTEEAILELENKNISNLVGVPGKSKRR